MSFNRLLKNGHLAAVLESQLVLGPRASACGPAYAVNFCFAKVCGVAPGLRSQNGCFGGVGLLRLRAAFCGCDDLTVFEQPEFFNNTLKD